MVSWKIVKAELVNMLQDAGIEDALQEANLLFEFVTGLNAVGQSAYLLSNEQIDALMQAARRRVSGYPIQYMFAEWPFLDFSVKVGEGVLIPRQDTEVVCEKAVAIGKEMQPTPKKIIDLCSGSGILAIAMKNAFPNADVTAVENSPQALFYLTENTSGKGVVVKEADVFMYQQDVMPETVDMITANPPYLTGEAMQMLQKEVFFEPTTALAGGEDGLLFYRHIIPAYKPALKQGGALVLEIGYDQKDAVMHLCKAEGYQKVEAMQDYGGNDRCVWAIK